jgi:hypothetical protein
LYELSPRAPETDPTQAARHLLGWWSLTSNEIEFRDGGARESMYGSPSRGYLIFTAEGRMMTCIEAEGRSPPTTEAEYARAFCSTCAYSGLYRVEGNRWQTVLDACWNPGWSGTLQERFFRIEADALHVTSPWYVSPLHSGREVRAHISWKRDPSVSRGRPGFENAQGSGNT